MTFDQPPSDSEDQISHITARAEKTKPCRCGNICYGEDGLLEGWHCERRVELARLRAELASSRARADHAERERDKAKAEVVATADAAVLRERADREAYRARLRAADHAEAQLKIATEAMDVQAHFHAVWKQRAEAAERVLADAIRERDELKETNSRPNRRCQSAEAALNERTEDWNKRSTDKQRNHYYARYMEAIQEIAELKATLAQFGAFVQSQQDLPEAAARVLRDHAWELIGEAQPASNTPPEDRPGKSKSSEDFPAVPPPQEQP